ncbi:unnamed protein product [Periconia digitata]|uniref:Rhodopsin domain-containing protein n=1 Tax=Periconia digitata TaxID=1303443 RepID=A0A9W4U8U6_9PLEO|nr:unnamed protein product [Periconia digitata]
MESRQNDVLGVAALFFLLTWITVSLRIYIRGVWLRTWVKDDWYMLAALTAYSLYLIFQIVAAGYGTGRHRGDLQDENARIALLYSYLGEVSYVLSSCLLKISLEVLYLGMAIRRWHIWCIRLLIAGTVLFGIINFFLVVFQCTPVSEFWESHPASDKCIPSAPHQGLTYFLATANALADWTLNILPFFIASSLSLETRIRNLITALLVFAAIASIAGTIRIPYTASLTSGGPDFLFATANLTTWSTVELGIGITAASILTLHPLLQAVLWRLNLTREPYPPSLPCCCRSASPRHPRDASASPFQGDEKGKIGNRRVWYRRDFKCTSTTKTLPTLLPVVQCKASMVIARPLSVARRSWHPRPRSHIPRAMDHSLETGNAEAELSRNFSQRRIWKVVRVSQHSQLQPRQPVLGGRYAGDWGEGGEDEEENAPRLQLDDSIYFSFVRGSILSLRQLIQDVRNSGPSSVVSEVQQVRE